MENQVIEISEEPKAEKKKYTEPKLTCYGTIADLTNSRGNVGSDGFTGSINKV